MLEMPQEFHVLLCYNCKTFQVQIIKKVPKWQCKMCTEKQSVKVYANGTSKECRLVVQELNKNKHLESDNFILQKIHQEHDEKPLQNFVMSSFTTTIQQNQENKWVEFINVEKENVQDSDLLAIDQSKYTFEKLPKAKRKAKSCKNVEVDGVKRSKVQNTGLETSQICDNIVLNTNLTYSEEHTINVDKEHKRNDSFKNIFEDSAVGCKISYVSKNTKKAKSVFDDAICDLDLSLNF